MRFFKKKTKQGFPAVTTTTGQVWVDDIGMPKPDIEVLTDAVGVSAGDGGNFYIESNTCIDGDVIVTGDIIQGSSINISSSNISKCEAIFFKHDLVRGKDYHISRNNNVIFKETEYQKYKDMIMEAIL